MDYTQSDAYVTDAGTGQRMHQSTAPITTEVSSSDVNGLTWEALELIKAAGLVPASFDKTVPATYSQVRDAIAIMVRKQSAAITSATGSADVLIGDYAPEVSAPVNGLTVYLRAAYANATPAPTFTPNDGTIVAKDIVKGNGLALVAGDIAGAGHWLTLKYDLTLDKWVLMNPALGVGILPALAAPSGASRVGYLPNGIGAVPRSVQAKLRDAVAVEDYVINAEANQTYAFIRAATYLLSKATPGGTITVNSNVEVTAGLINFWTILAAAQGITPADGYLPNGQLVRGTKLSIKGWGYDQSRIAVTGAGDAFSWGYFVSIASKRAMSGDVDGIDFVGPGAVGHASQVIIAGAQGYSTVTNASAGTTNTTTRCLVLHEVVPGTSVTHCRFRYFQEAVHQVYGFGFVAAGNDIQYCNIGYFFDSGVTTWDVQSGNEIELCAVGVFSKNTSNGTIGAAVIEANLAGCDVLVWCSKYLSMRGTWFEASNKNIVLRGDITAPSVPNSGFSFDGVIGLNIDNNGGLTNFRASKCAMNTLGESFSVSFGEQFANIVYDECTHAEAAFDLASITLSGIAVFDKIKVIGATTGGVATTYPTREPLRKRGLTVAASAAAQPTVSFSVPNFSGTSRIVITATKVDNSGGGYRTQTMYYVGILIRALNATSDYYHSTPESIVTNYVASGATDNTVLAAPSVFVTGANNETQKLTLSFATGTPVAGTCSTFWDAVIYPDVDGVIYS